MNTKDLKYKRKARRRKSIKTKIYGSAERPRLTVYKSLNNIYAQIIDDDASKTLVSASSIDSEIKPQLTEKVEKLEQSKIVGKVLAERAIEKGVKRVKFDRNGNIYTGRIKAIADAAREGGLEF